MLVAPAVWRAHKSGGSCRRCTASCRHPTATPPPCLSPCRALDAYLKRHQKRGLRHIVRRLKEELLVLGIISLLLVAFEVSSAATLSGGCLAVAAVPPRNSPNRPRSSDDVSS